ncbi:MAG TPA: hypothetical protein GXZ30_09830 [Propionibacterium sp.]|jgi:hypothetical protein|nr:hypothetical protein [Propionibacterium sp.]
MTSVITTYLQDHHAGSAAGTDAFRRVADSHSDPHVRTTVGRIAEAVEEDQAALEKIMAALGTKPSLFKDVSAMAGEKVARLKPNERVTKRSPLSDVLELEALVLAVQGKALGWRMLLEVQDRRIDRQLLDELLMRAVNQRDELEELRLSQAVKLREE